MRKKSRTKELLTYKELSELLKVKVQTLRNLVSKNALPFKKISGIGVRFCWAEILDWIEYNN